MSFMIDDEHSADFPELTPLLKYRSDWWDTIEAIAAGFFLVMGIAFWVWVIRWLVGW